MIEKIFKVGLIVMLTVFLANCATHNVQRYGSVDSSNKTVTVPPGSEGLKGQLKQALVNEGWKLVVYRGPSVIEGEIGEKTKVQQYNTFNTKYRLIVSYNERDTMLCLNFRPAVEYDISFIDNKSGTEVFTISGHGCEPSVVENFLNALHAKNK